MDWPRVKNILIVSFLILNLVLAFRLYLQPNLAFSAERLSEESLDAIVHVLEQNGVTIGVALPRTLGRIPAKKIRVQAYTAAEVTRMSTQVLGPAAEQTSPNAFPLEDQPVSFVSGFEELVITSRGFVTYYDRGLTPANTVISEEEAQAIADKFMREKLGNPADFVADGINYIEPMGYRVDYVQKHKDSLMFPGYIMMIVKPSGVAAMWLCRLEIGSQRFSGKDILSSQEALLNLLSYRLNSGETSQMEVLKVDLGYHGGIHDSDQAWDAVPVWRIYTSVGDFFVNALSGIIEQ